MTTTGKRRGVYRLIALTALLLACSDSHGPNAGTSGSNWLSCTKLADCGDAVEAVACSAEGYCVDAQGERIAADDDARAPLGVAGSSASRRECPRGTDALLAEIGVEIEDHFSCGSNDRGDRTHIERSVSCVADALDQGRATEISVSRCPGCATTIVADDAAAGFMIEQKLLEEDGEQLREVIVSECQDVLAELDPLNAFVGCSFPIERYRCKAPPLAPQKLAEVPAAGNEAARETLHLLVRNQSASEPLVGIDLYVDDVHVVTGDFAAESARTEFTIQVPHGEHRVRASGPHAADSHSDIDMFAEYWVAFEYSNELPNDAGFTSGWQPEPFVINE